MTALPFCACGCGRRMPPEHAINGWRTDCLALAGDDVRGLQNLDAADLGLLIAFLRARGRDRLANMIVGGLPIEATDA